MGKQQKIKEAEQPTALKIVDNSGREAPAEVLEILGHVSSKQGGTQVRCKLLSGPEESKIMRRNVFGPIRIGDILILRETEIDASPVRGKKGF